MSRSPRINRPDRCGMQASPRYESACSGRFVGGAFFSSQGTICTATAIRRVVHAALSNYSSITSWTEYSGYWKSDRNIIYMRRPDSMLYLSVGSTCNACGEDNPENATMLQVAPDGSSRTIFASGLRNTIGFGFHPESGDFYGMDHGTDWLGDNVQHEELNRIAEGNNYGWPYIYDDGQYNPQDEPPTNAEGADVRVTEANDGPPPAETPAQLAIDLVEAPDTSLGVTSSAFDDGDALPDAYAAEGENISPPLDWDEGPAGTQSYVLLMEDPDASQKPPFVHWILYDIPADTTSLAEGLPGTPRLPMLAGALQGTNDRGSTGYFGPRPPEEDPAHAYHFQIFVLDTTLDLPHGASRAEILDAIEGHVLASGELVGTYER